MVSQHFKSFNTNYNTFVANDMLAYEYPVDHSLQGQMASEVTNGKDAINHSSLKGLKDIAETVTAELKRFARHLETLVSFPDSNDGASRDNLSLLSWIKTELLAVSEDHEESGPAAVLAPRSPSSMVSPVVASSARLRRLLNIFLEVRGILQHRATCKESAKDLKFGLGDVVYHTVFGFRGVVVGFDMKPVVDVSRWDGLVDVEDPLEKPFFHVVPDQEDCINVFGSERGIRYVCQDNMEMCLPEKRVLAVQLETGWTRTLTSEGVTKFIAPSRIMVR